MPSCQALFAFSETFGAAHLLLHKILIFQKFRSLSFSPKPHNKKSVTIAVIIYKAFLYILK